MLRQVPLYLEFTSFDVNNDIDTTINTLIEGLHDINCEYIWDEKNNKFSVVAFYKAHPSIEIIISLFHNSGPNQNNKFRYNSIVIEISRNSGSVIRYNMLYQKIKAAFGLTQNLYKMRPPTLIYTDIMYSNNDNHVISLYLNNLYNKNPIESIVGLYSIISDSNKINITNFKKIYNSITDLFDLKNDIEIDDMLFQTIRLLKKMSEYKRLNTNRKIYSQIDEFKNTIISKIHNKNVEDFDDFCLLYKQIILDLD